MHAIKLYTMFHKVYFSRLYADRKCNYPHEIMLIIGIRRAYCFSKPHGHVKFIGYKDNFLHNKMTQYQKRS